jgi:hypothetical protein
MATDTIDPRAARQVQFAAVLVIFLGASNLIQGIAAAASESVFSVTPDGLLVWDYDGWAAIWFIFGTIQLLAGFGILAGKRWARILGVVVLMLAALCQVAFLVAFPLWGVLTISLAVVAINALLVHGAAYASSRQ